MLSALVLSVLTVACDVLEMGMLKKVGGMATDGKGEGKGKRDSSAHWMDARSCARLLLLLLFARASRRQGGCAGCTSGEWRGVDGRVSVGGGWSIGVERSQRKERAKS